MNDKQQQQEQQQQQQKSTNIIIASYILVALVALVFRVVDLGGFANEDEVRYWLIRSQTFLNALQHGDFAATAISTHPGVTTMWLGSVGILLRRALLAWDVVESVPFPLRLALMRLPAALVHTVGVVSGYWFLRRLFAPAVALLAVLLWATDPFVLAFSRILHVDALAMTFSMLSVLAACYYWHHGAHWRWLLLSGCCAALAILSKSPALVLFGVAGLQAGLAFFHRNPEESLTHWLKNTALRLLIWSGACAVTCLLVWPSFWTDPMRVYNLMRIGIEVEGGSPHVQGNYFLGQEDNEPGLLFYPVALALRMTPWTLVGILLLPLAAKPRRRDIACGRDVACYVSTERETTILRNLAILAGFAILVVAGLSVFPKKLNRYLIPMFPAINILAAYGLVQGTLVIIALVQRQAEKTRLIAIGQRVIVAVVALLALANAVWYHPYGIAYFNQLLGGPKAGAWAFLIGAGEGLEQVADWLNQRHDITGVVTVTTMPPPLQPYLRHGAYAGPPDGDDLPDKTGYVVVYVRNVWGHALPPFDQFYQRKPPVRKVAIHGVDYAWIYQVPQPVEHVVGTDFGDALQLQGYEMDTSAIQSSGTLSLTLQWKTIAPVEKDYMLFVHVFNNAGERVAQADVPPGGAILPTHTWEAHSYTAWVHPVPVPSDLLKERTYWVAIGLYDPESFQRLPLTVLPPPDAPDDGEHVLFLEP